MAILYMRLREAICPVRYSSSSCTCTLRLYYLADHLAKARKLPHSQTTSSRAVQQQSRCVLEATCTKPNLYLVTSTSKVLRSLIQVTRN